MLNLSVIQINSYYFSKSNCTFTGQDIICYHHEKFHLSHFQNLQRYYSDPWEKHSKQIKKYLQVIDIKTARKLNLKPGQKFCRHCYERVANDDSLNTEEKPEDSEACFYDCTFEKNKSSFNAEGIGMSPIKKSYRDKISYGRNKLKRIKVDNE